MIKLKTIGIFLLLFSSFFAIVSSGYAEEQSFDYKTPAVIAAGKLEATDPTYRRLNSNNHDNSDACAVVVSSNATAATYDTVVLPLNPKASLQNWQQRIANKRTAFYSFIELHLIRVARKINAFTKMMILTVAIFAALLKT